MKIAVIGAKGVIGNALVEHFNSREHEIIAVDLDTSTTVEEASHIADVVFIAILPLRNVPAVFATVVNNIGDGKMIVNCSSVHKIKGIDDISDDFLIERNITVCHWHLHFTPTVSLEKSLFGKNITTFFSGRVDKKWKKWLKSQFFPYGPFWHEISNDEHDFLTDISQLTHMITTPMVGAVWKRSDQSRLEKALRIGGPPQWLLELAVLRASNSPQVSSEILCEHPHTLEIIETMRNALDDLERHVKNGNVSELSEMMARPRLLLSPSFLEITDRTTKALIDHESDRRVRNTVILRFSHEQDVSSLCEEVGFIFKDRGVDLTAILPEVDPCNGTVLRISFENFDERAQAAVATVQKTWNLT